MSESIRSVERALEVLLCFSLQTPELSMTQIAERVGMNKSTVHRLLGTLEKMRFVQRDPLSGLYQPGIRLLQLAYLTLEHNDLRNLAHPFMVQLSELLQENVNLSTMDNDSLIYLHVVEGSQRVKLAAAAGQRLPAFCTASGKAILAFLPEDKARQILNHTIKQYTSLTITSMEKIFNNFKHVQDHGYATSIQEFEDGINAVAAPIFDPNHVPIASISVAGPAYRLTENKMKEISSSVIKTANEISREMRTSIQINGKK